MKNKIAHSKAIKKKYWIECYFRLWSLLAYGILKELLLKSSEILEHGSSQ